MNQNKADKPEFGIVSYDEIDEQIRPAPDSVHFEEVLDKAMSRRDFFKGGVLLFGSSLFLQSSLASATAQHSAQKAFDVFDFESIAVNVEDTITLPKDYQWRPLVSWGDPMWSQGKTFDADKLLDSAAQKLAFGDNNDGMKHFTVDGRELLAINNEYVNFAGFFSNRKSGAPETVDDICKTMEAVGVSIIEIQETEAGWQLVKDSPFNRRITAQTPMEITGPARGHALMQTKQDPRGVEVLGTWANCGSGKTPWETYLTCEENFNGFYTSSDADLEINTDLKRYGFAHSGYGYDWSEADERFDLAKEINEPNRSGYVVEIDPSNPNSKPKKRTALGRFKHENAEMVVAKNGQIVVYMGDDERGEFLYRYVSNNAYHENADIDDLMENGILYVAKFAEDGSGVWLPLTEKTTGMSLAEICIHSRQAGSKVGATTMDRPEWVAANPNKAEVYCSLTNNKIRGLQPNKGGDAQPVGGPNPRAANKYGQVVRWIPEGDDHAADKFAWNLFVLGGNPQVHKSGLEAGSANIDVSNMFNSPDGVHFDSQGKLWIQTDGKTSNQGEFAGMGNNQMLLANPLSGEIKRFMVAPNGAEVSGFAFSNDRKTLFVGIQHPGEWGIKSTFPYGDVPRSTVIAIRHKSGYRIV